MLVSNALLETGTQQRQRVVDRINAQIKVPQKEKIGENYADRLDKLIKELERDGETGKQARGGSPIGAISQAGSTPPRQQPPSLIIHDNNHDDSDGQWFLSATRENGGDNGGGGGGDNGGSGANGSRDDGKDNSYDSNEFTLVNSRNIEMKKFTGEQSCKLTYLEFNDSQREPVGIKGRHGIILNKLLTWAEEQGDNTIIDTLLEKCETAVPKILEYNRAIHASLKNWTDGEAKRFIKYEVTGGLDAWRKLYIEYIPLAQTRPDFILSEILELKPVSSKDVRKFLNRIEELRYKYNQCGGTPLGDNIVKTGIGKVYTTRDKEAAGITFRISKYLPASMQTNHETNAR